MKLKARNIIEGWPRGRSTMSPYFRETLWHMVFFNRRFALGWSGEELTLVSKELEANDTYHQMQQAMVNEWFAMYRIKKNPFIDKCVEECMTYFGIPTTYASPGEIGRAHYIPVDDPITDFQTKASVSFTKDDLIRMGVIDNVTIDNVPISPGSDTWRRRMAAVMVEEQTEPEEFWWLSFCDPDKPKGSQFLGVVVVKAHGITDALTKCNVMMINPGGEVKGMNLTDCEEARKHFTPETLNRLLSFKDMMDLGWQPCKESEL